MKQVKVEISTPVMESFFQESERAFAITKGLPESSRMVKLQFNQKTGNHIATFEDDGFDDIQPGQTVPFVNIEYTAYEVEKPRIVTVN